MSAPPTDPRTAHFDDDTALELAHGLLDDAAVRAAIAHAQSCPECDHRLRVAAAERERFRARQRDVLAEPASGPGAPPRDEAVTWTAALRRWRAPLGIAAAFALVAAWLTLRAPSAPPASRTIRLPSPVEVLRQRDAAESAELERLDHALDRYARGDDREASSLLAAPFRTSRLEPVRRLYRASALLELGEASEARPLLEGFDRNAVPEPFADWLDWAHAALAEAPGSTARQDSVARALAARPGALQQAARTWLLRRDRPDARP